MNIFKYIFQAALKESVSPWFNNVIILKLIKLQAFDHHLCTCIIKWCTFVWCKLQIYTLIWSYDFNIVLRFNIVCWFLTWWHAFRWRRLFTRIWVHLMHTLNYVLSTLCKCIYFQYLLHWKIYHELIKVINLCSFSMNYETKKYDF